jgi:biopolymer transport protein TolQ
MLQNAPESGQATPQAIDLDPLSLLLHASGPVRIVNWALIIAAIAVWIVAVLKLLQLGRSRSDERGFEIEATRAQSAAQLLEIARRHGDAPSARIVMVLAQDGHAQDMPAALAKRAFVVEEQRAGRLLGILSTVGSAAPFVGLFGTVWGILDAFLRIGREKSASLPVVAPAIGEALISTAVGLFAAIPAVVLFNVASKRADDLLAGVEAAIDGWVTIAGHRSEKAQPQAPLSQPSSPPASPGFPPPRVHPL